LPVIPYLGADLFYEERGAGAPLVLLHGGDATHSSWRYQIPAFAKHHRVIAPDSRGFGRSTSLLGLHAWDVEADDLREILDRLEIEQAILVGYSMGAVVIRQFVEKHADRAQAVVLVGASYDPAGQTVEALRRRIIDLEAAREAGRYGRTAALAWVFTPEFVRDHPDEWEIYRRCAAETPIDSYCLRMLGTAVYPPKSRLPTPDVWTMPALFVWGEHDRNTPVAPQFAAALPSARIEIIPGHGHAVYFSAPDAFNQAVLSFLAELPE
jgi:pimeloyl-ACP methyl ester carboxylesterase